MRPRRLSSLVCIATFLFLPCCLRDVQVALLTLCSSASCSSRGFQPGESSSGSLRAVFQARAVCARHCKGEGGSEESPTGSDADFNLLAHRAQLSRSLTKSMGEVEAAPARVEHVEQASTAVSGDVLLAHPRQFAASAARAGVGDMGNTLGDVGSVVFKALVFFGMGDSDMFMKEFPQREKLRRMPVVLLTQRNPDGSGEGFSLTARTGRLLGDFEGFEGFMTRPVHTGGPDKGLFEMVHSYPQVRGASKLDSSDLYIGGDFKSAQDWVNDGEGSSLRFRFFVGKVSWGRGELDGELQRGQWLVARGAQDSVLDEAQGLNTKPLWAKLADDMGDEVRAVGRAFGLLD